MTAFEVRYARQFAEPYIREEIQMDNSGKRVSSWKTSIVVAVVLLAIGGIGSACSSGKPYTPGASEELRREEVEARDAEEAKARQTTASSATSGVSEGATKDAIEDYVMTDLGLGARLERVELRDGTPSGVVSVSVEYASTDGDKVVSESVEAAAKLADWLAEQRAKGEVDWSAYDKGERLFEVVLATNDAPYDASDIVKLVSKSARSFAVSESLGKRLSVYAALAPSAPVPATAAKQGSGEQASGDDAWLRLNDNVTAVASAAEVPSFVEGILVDAFGEGERISGVSLNGTDLMVSVDLSHVDPSPLTWGELLELMTASFTDQILVYRTLDQYWQTITIDFGAYGSIVLGKGDVQRVDYDGKHHGFTMDGVKIADHFMGW